MVERLTLACLGEPGLAQAHGLPSGNELFGKGGERQHMLNITRNSTVRGLIALYIKHYASQIRIGMMM